MAGTLLSRPVPLPSSLEQLLLETPVPFANLRAEEQVCVNALG